MPKKNGLQLLDEIIDVYRSTEEELEIKLFMPQIVFLTAYMSSNFTKFLQKKGISQIYEKPLQQNQLVDIIQSVTHRDRVF